MKIALLGYGKMGRLIAQLAEAQGHEVVLRIGIDNVHELNHEALRHAEVAIEFSTPETAVANIRLCAEAGIPVVVGTTGWYAHYENTAAYVLERGGALLAATNFSLGVNLYFALTERLGQLMQPYAQYEARIEETHHVHKLDAPSGTAITSAERLLNGLTRYQGWSLNGQQAGSLPVMAYRIDEVPGTHEVIFSNNIDEIRLTHTAFNREGFASGAIYAAHWLAGKQGVFSMRDVLGLG